MITIKGDLIKLAQQGRFDVIVHGCNCFCTMGAGIAKTIKRVYPAAYAADCATDKGNKSKLGQYSIAEIIQNDNALFVVNAYTQFDYKGHGVLVDYGALERVFAQIKRDFAGKRIAYPKIGAGLAGGNWPAIAAIIENQLQGECHTLVEYAPD